MRIAAVGDLHCRADTRRNVAVALRGVDQEADVLLLAGDLTDHGTREEASWLAEELSQVKMEKCAVLGNHDYESGQSEEVKSILGGSGVHVLDGDPWALNDLGVAGVKGFAGGFEVAQLQRFGEEAMKAFVDASIAEELKLEKALFQLRTRHRIALLHYAPCRPTRIIFADVAGSRAAIHLSVWLAQIENMGLLRILSAARHQVTWA